VKRKKTVEHVSHERWLVSYADFITLMFAFFVVMFASTQADKAKAKVVSESVREALEHGEFATAISTVLGRGKHEATLPRQFSPRPDAKDNTPPLRPSKSESHPGESHPVDLVKSMETLQGGLAGGGSHPDDLVKSMETLQRGLATEMVAGKVQLKLEARGLVISLREAAFFASGDDTVSPASFPILVKIATVIQALPNPLRLEGYTDSVPIRNSRFCSNWELSTARSIAMLELLRQRFRIPSARMSVAGYAENAPADTNETEQGRAHNRRVDVVVLSAEALKIEPQSAPQKSSMGASPGASSAVHP
jgi:chemotaxis protein MotB